MPRRPRRRKRTAEDEAALKGLGLAVQRKRQELEMTPHLVAKRAGLSGGAVGDIERGEAEPHWGTIRRLAQALEMEPHELVTLATELAPGRGGAWMRRRRREAQEKRGEVEES